MEQLFLAIAWEHAYQFWLEGRRIMQGRFDTPSREEFVHFYREVTRP